MIYPPLHLIQSPMVKLRSQRHYHAIFSTLLAVAALLLTQASAQAQALDYVDASFSVEYNNKVTQAENTLKIHQDNNHYQINFDLEHWLLSAKQQATFDMDMEQCHVQPISYRSTNKQPFKEEKNQSITFDWSRKKAKFVSESEQKTFDLDPPLYDPLSFFFEARCELMAGKKDFAYPLIYKGNKRDHRYRVVGTEKVNTGLGQLEALVIERVRDSKTRKTRLFVAPGLDYLLVKFEHQESRMVTISATLQRMDYRLASH